MCDWYGMSRAEITLISEMDAPQRTSLWHIAMLAGRGSPYQSLAVTINMFIILYMLGFEAILVL